MRRTRTARPSHPQHGRSRRGPGVDGRAARATLRGLPSGIRPCPWGWCRHEVVVVERDVVWMGEANRYAVLQADQAQPVRRSPRGAKRSAAGMGLQPIPWRQAARAAPPGAQASAMKAREGRDATGGSMRQHASAARPRRETHKSVNPANRIHGETQNRRAESTGTHARLKAQSRETGNTIKHANGCAHLSEAAQPQFRASGFTPKRTNAQAQARLH